MGIKITKERIRLEYDCITTLLEYAGKPVTSYQIMKRFREDNPSIFKNTRSFYWIALRDRLMDQNLLSQPSLRLFAVNTQPGSLKRLNEIKMDLQSRLGIKVAPAPNTKTDVGPFADVTKQLDELFAKAEQLVQMKRVAAAHLNRILELEAMLNDPARRLVNQAMAKKILDQRREIAEFIDEQKQFRALILKQEQHVKELEKENARLWHDLDAASDPASKIPPEDKKLLDELGVDLNGEDA